MMISDRTAAHVRDKKYRINRDQPRRKQRFESERYPQTESVECKSEYEVVVSQSACSGGNQQPCGLPIPPTSQQPNWQAQHLTRPPVDSASLTLPTSLNLNSFFFFFFFNITPSNRNAFSCAILIFIHNIFH
jgi:hypothetical protein